jgi:hypothetical protein
MLNVGQRREIASSRQQKDLLALIGLSSNETFEGLTDTEKALPLVKDALKTLMPEEEQQKSIEQQDRRIKSSKSL